MHIHLGWSGGVEASYSEYIATRSVILEGLEPLRSCFNFRSAEPSPLSHKLKELPKTLLPDLGKVRSHRESLELCAGKR